MGSKLLGSHFDIHGGGADLQFPHHENEIAQSEGARQCSFVNYWMHNGFVNVDKEKMSKSLGNFFTIREVLKKYDAEIIRFFILRAHYRSPLNYSDVHLEDAKQSLSGLYTALKNVPTEGEVAVDWQESHSKRFKAAMDDDFNTPEAMAVLFDLAKQVNITKLKKHASLLKALGGVLGLLQREPLSFLQGRPATITTNSNVTLDFISASSSAITETVISDDQINEKYKYTVGGIYGVENSANTTTSLLMRSLEFDLPKSFLRKSA
jgi:cysteinyl-tRNA synthetase